MTLPQGPTKSDELSPRLAMFQLITGHYVSHAIYVVARLGIADLLGKGPRSCDELASASGAHPPSLHRLLRMLVSAGVFSEKEDGRFESTPLGECLQSERPGSSRDTAFLFAGPLTKFWTELLHSVQTGEPAFERAMGLDPFRYMSQHPEEAAIFNQAMTAASAQASISVAANYDFSQFAQVVDVGGGHGILISAILKAHPAVSGLVYELPSVAEGARKALESAGLSARCQVVAGDFFADVPDGADVYILKSVIHDWNDEKSVTILKNCHRAMAPDGKLLLVEAAMPSRVTKSGRNQIITGSDVNMLLIGGRERTDAEFRNLFEASGFRLTRILPLEGTLMSILEGERV